MSLEYLAALHRLHEEWLIEKRHALPGVPILVMDANKSLKEFTVDIEDEREKILCASC